MWTQDLTYRGVFSEGSWFISFSTGNRPLPSRLDMESDTQPWDVFQRLATWLVNSLTRLKDDLQRRRKQISIWILTFPVINRWCSPSFSLRLLGRPKLRGHPLKVTFDSSHHLRQRNALTIDVLLVFLSSLQTDIINAPFCALYTRQRSPNNRRYPFKFKIKNFQLFLSKLNQKSLNALK